jgi:chromosome segregation ATPase
MSGGSNLEQQLGELTGYLKALGPVLQKVEERQSEGDKKAAGMEAKLEAIRTEFNEVKVKVSNRIGELYGKINALSGDLQKVRGEKELLEKEVSTLKAKSDGVKQKAWDLLKILITVAVTLIATKLWGK